MHKSFNQAIQDCLVKKGIISNETIDSLLKEIIVTKENFLTALIKKNLISKASLLDIISQNFNLPAIDLKNYVIDKAAVEKVPARIAFYYKFIPLRLKEKTLTVACALPFDIKTQDEIRTHISHNIEVALVLEDDLLDAQKRLYGLGADTLDKISLREGPVVVSREDVIENIEELAEDASIVKFVNQIIFEAFKRRATDIHIEPQRQGVSIRYRIDGILYDANVPLEIKRFILPIISRIKIMCNLNIVEKRMPQDGRTIVKTQEQTLDLRISTLPTLYGESMVIRILPTSMLFDLAKLGLEPKDLKIIEDLISRPHGIILITGPTGSGKTTTLYASLSKLNTPDRKIITIEDPIEYELRSITQIQVMPDIGLDFARGLRSILRHDPDIIMVGEIRDMETAEIAIRVSLTGHLVFSTLHTKDAPSGATRLIDIGIEPYLVASSVEAFIAQRLVRVICPQCKCEDLDAPMELKEKITKELGLSNISEAKIYKGKGCDNCEFSGYVGRTGIYELLLLNESIRELIVKRASSEDIKRQAMASGMHTLKQDGWRKVIAGVTTFSEILRVAPNEDFNVSKAKSTAVGVAKNDNFLDSRTFLRLDTHVALQYRVVKAKEELVQKDALWEKLSATKNISAGGVAFIAIESIPVGAIIEVQLNLPDDKAPLNCFAKVLWVKQLDGSYEAGICFLDLTGSERTRVNAFVTKEY